MKKAQKVELVERLKSDWSAVNTAFLVDFRGLSVNQDTRLRKEVRAKKASYRVLKNTLATRAIEGGSLAGLAERLDGPTAIAYTDDDPVALAKVLVDFAKDSPLSLKGGILEGQPLAAEDVTKVAAMPSRPELVAQLVGLLGSPVRRLAVAMNAPISQFVNVLNQVKVQKEEAAG